MGGAGAGVGGVVAMTIQRSMCVCMCVWMAGVIDVREGGRSRMARECANGAVAINHMSSATPTSAAVPSKHSHSHRP